MAICSMKRLLTIATIIALLVSVSNGKSVKPSFKIKAVNLGGWLVTEGWIKPSLFDGIPNKDFLDGTALQFKSVTVGKYLRAKSGGGSGMVADRTSASDWETFKLWRINASDFNLRVFKKQFMGLDRNGDRSKVVAVSEIAGRLETFKIVRNPKDDTRVRIKASNGFFLQVKTEKLVTADYVSETKWRDNDPSVFIMSINGSMHGEFQVTNGYGPELAPKAMHEHWKTYITEDDFKFIYKNGINAVRIPVGWWIASDPTPPRPYVGGSLQALDNAFSWAEKYRLKVIIDLHAAPGSQNGQEHSSSRDGSQEWGFTDSNIQQTVDVIEFLTSRYAKSPSLYGVELLNEPFYPGVTIEMLKKYYRAGYNVVRKHSSTAYVVMSNRIGSPELRELFPIASGLPRSVVDVHFYNFFTNMTAQQNINYVSTNWSAQLKYITTSNGPLIFVGEWTGVWGIVAGEWGVKNATKREYQEFCKAQLKLYKRASFGWGYWTLKNVNVLWSLEWMVNNGYIKL